jgi:hypothetical protein
MKAVIVEIKGKYAAILAENGLVSKVRNRNYEIGQEIVLNNNKAKLIRMTAAAAAAIMIFVTPAWAYLTPYSYVSLDVNPSFEFFVNRFDRVLTVKAFNDDGGEMSKDIDIDGLKNKEIQTAVKSVLNELKNKGYINEGQKDGVIVAASSKSEKKTDILSKKIRAAVSEEVVPEKPEARDDTLTEEPEVIPETDETANNNKQEKPKEQAKAQEQAKPEKTEKPEKSEKPEKPEKQEKSDREKWVRQEEPDREKWERREKSEDQEKREGREKFEDREKWENREKSDDKDKQESREWGEENKQDRKTFDIKVIEVTEKEVNEAKKMGITPGKLNLIGKLQEAANLAGHEINPDKWLGKSVHEINEKIKEYKEELKQKEKYNKDKNDKSNNSKTPSNKSSKNENENWNNPFDFNGGRDKKRY